MLDFKKLVFVGLDPHKSQHTGVMIDHWNHVLWSAQIPNLPSEFPAFLDQVDAATPKGFIAVFGIEDTGGLGRSLAQWLVAQDRLVKGVNPILSDERRNKRPHSDKNDTQDARSVARVLTEDFDTLPTVQEDAHFQALREGTRRRDQLVKDRTRCKNQLHGLLHTHYPDYKAFFSDPFGKTALAFWHAYPHPSELRHIGTTRLIRFLRKQARNMSTGRAELILQHVDKEKPVAADDAIRITVVRQLVEHLQQLGEHIATIEALLAKEVATVEAHLTTLHGVSNVTAAKIGGRIGPPDRFRSGDQIARHAGIAPQERTSDRRGRVRRSKSGDRQLNAAFHQIALNQICVTRDGQPRCPIAYHYYHRKIAEGKSKLSALTCLKRRLCDIVFAMLRDRSVYQPPDLAALRKPAA